MLDLRDEFYFAGGSERGSDHVRDHKQLQDAFYYTATSTAAVAVVADGCGSSPHSEVGAKLGARLFAHQLIQDIDLASQYGDPGHSLQAILSETRRGVAGDLRHLTSTMCDPLTKGHFAATINDYFMFTLVGAVVTRSRTRTFSIGDGYVVVNGMVTTLGPYPDNSPPYIGYSVGNVRHSEPYNGFEFTSHHELATDDVDSILLGTDGVEPLVKNGSLHEFWHDDRYVRNPDNIRRRLAVLNKPTVTPVWEERRIETRAGLLTDDATIVVIKRRY